MKLILFTTDYLQNFFKKWSYKYVMFSVQFYLSNKTIASVTLYFPF